MRSLNVHLKHVAAGDYDTDNGGRDPQRRSDLRGAIAGALLTFDSLTEEDWKVLPQHDLTLILESLGETVAKAAKYNRVRLAQSGSTLKRGEL